jgi:hypothetical protein
MPYVDAVDYLQEVKSATYYKQKRAKNRDPNDLSRTGTSPKTPRTRRGTKIIEGNFPEADLVCPCCERGFTENVERTVRPLSPETFMSTSPENNDMELDKAQIEEIVEGESEAVRDFKDGEDGAINYLVGTVMQETGGKVNPVEARDALKEYIGDRVADVTLHYRDRYNFAEKKNVCDNIPDTDEAREMFKYSPEISVTFEWDKNEGTLSPESATIDGEEYELDN